MFRSCSPKISFYKVDGSDHQVFLRFSSASSNTRVLVRIIHNLIFLNDEDNELNEDNDEKEKNLENEVDVLFF